MIVDFLAIVAEVPVILKVETEGDKFAISNTGEFTTKVALDYDDAPHNYSVEISITDGTNNDNAVVEVEVTDVNDNSPVFTSSSVTKSVPEDADVGTTVTAVPATDKDSGLNREIRYSLRGGLGRFSIDPVSGVVSVAAALDRETQAEHELLVVAEDQGRPARTATATLLVQVSDINDNVPKFSEAEYQVEVLETVAVGTSLHSLSATDPDEGANGRVTYSITQQSPSSENAVFELDSSSGTLQLVQPLDYSKVEVYRLTVQASDGGTPSLNESASVVVKVKDVNNNPPEFSKESYEVSISENLANGASILTLEVTDKDEVDFFAVGDPPVILKVETEGDKFAISNTGEFTTKVALDYDDAPHNYSVEISITDGTNNDSAVVEVEVTDVNDNSPVFTSSSVTKSVPEDADVGTTVTAVPATDKDSGLNREIRYSLRGGLGRFSINPMSGVVSVAAALDRETQAEHELLVVAEDQGRPARTATATLLVQVSDINDNVPKFTEAEYQVEVLETVAVGTSLHSLSATDPDEGANGRVTYSITQQSPSSENAVFELDSSSGTLQLVQPLDYSKVEVYRLTVQASDGGTPSLNESASVVVKVKDVNNNPPEFSKESYEVSISENLASGASILTLEVTDKDEGGFSNGYFLYENDTFDISNQGIVSLRKDVTLDREKTDSYILQVVAVDQVTNGLSSTAQLNVTVLDFNDNTPQFPSIPDPLWIPEGDYSEESPGKIFTIVPTDVDLGLNGEVILSLPSPHPLFRFREDGTLLAVAPLDRESRDTYELVVKASDKGVPQRETITTIRVSLSDVNDNKPEFSSSSYVSSILLKDAEAGKLLLTLSATDRDMGDNGIITYSFSAGNSPYLALNSETGEVMLTSDLADVTEDTAVELTAMAKDHGQPPLDSTARVVVNLRVSSLVEAVAFQSSSYTFSLPENLPVGATVGKVKASSGSDLYDVAYALKKYTDLFSIDTSGAILTTAQLDKEQQEWFILDVEAVDTRTPLQQQWQQSVCRWRM
ncbi:cadherin EGF LAG seven-pass G-type receptor 1-like [Acanthochromis polyacanthus]|uniref:cadherin EGF LAG seven-pass G-type receptor 1-like n=1 Tax=Acanthochromis polyacanthus TaxID=80966 RepID=UPI0022349E92|nr:cadherin EGF LAG seven-pass G-type receptor 1-like [Acanthochromis polyacanthus]